MEAIIASVVILASLTYFFKIDLIGSQWGDVNLQTQSKDIVASLYKDNTLTDLVRNNDISGINTQLTNKFQRTIDFSVTIKGIPNAVIYVGCNCTSGEITQLKSILGITGDSKFKYKNRDIEILVRQESIENITDETNVLFMFNYRNLTNVLNYLNSFMLRGGTVFVLTDLTETQVNDGIFNNIFGLSWTSGSPSVDSKFYDINNPNNVSFYIAKYFMNTSKINKNTTFTSFGSSSSRVASGPKTIIVDDTGIFAYAKTNSYIIEGNGRTVWLANYPYTDLKANNLTRALMMWASGEKYTMNSYKKTVPISYTESSYIIQDDDPYQFLLTVWKIF